MRYEFKKISRGAMLLLLAAVLVNAWMFYGRCTQRYGGYTLSQIRAAFGLSDAELEKADLESGGQIILASSGELKHQSLGDAVRARRDFDYAAYAKTIADDAALRINSGMFGDDGSFAVRSLKETEAIYTRLAGLRVKPAFSGSIEAINGWRVSDLFFLLFGIVPCLFLLTQERRAGMYVLIKPTKHGHGRLYLQKFAVMTAFILAGFLLIYGADLAISGGLFGFGSLSRPIQSAYGCRQCPEALTVFGYMLLYLTAKLLWGFAVCALFFAICAAMPTISAALLAAAAVLALSLAMGASGSMWLHALSITALAESDDLLLQCRFLNLFGTPVRALAVSICFLVLLAALSYVGGLLAFIKAPATSAERAGGAFRLSFLTRHTNLTLHEWQKCLHMHGALALLLVMLAVQFASYRNFDAPSSEFDYYYRMYSDRLSGAKSETSAQFLADERARFDGIHAEIARCYEAADGDTALAELLTTDLQNELRAEPAFDAAKAQYEGLGAGESYVYRTGYERLLGRAGQRDDLINAVKLFCFLILSFSGVFAVERETGVEILQKTAGAEKKLAARKIIVCAVIMLAAFCLAYLPQYLAVRSNYGLPEQSAAVGSLSLFSAFPHSFSIRGALWAVCLLRLAVCSAASAVILLLSRKTGSKVLTVAISSALLIIPTAIAILFV